MYSKASHGVARGKVREYRRGHSEVLGDKGYSKVECHEEITDYHADPYIPFKIDATGGSASKEDVWERAYHYYMLNRAQFLQH